VPYSLAPVPLFQGGVWFRSGRLPKNGRHFHFYRSWHVWKVKVFWGSVEKIAPGQAGGKSRSVVAWYGNGFVEFQFHVISSWSLRPLKGAG